MTCAFRRAPRVPFRTDEKERKVRLRTLHLGRPARAAPGARYARRPLAGAPPRDPGLSPLRGPDPMGRNSKRDLREYLAITRRLPSLPTGTPAEGSIQVAGAPNDGNGAASLPGRGTRGRVADPPPVRRTRIGLSDRGVSCGRGPQLTCAPGPHLEGRRPSRPGGQGFGRRPTL